MRVLATSICLHCGQSCEQRETDANDFGERITQWVHYTGQVICEPTTTVRPDPARLVPGMGP